jgi:predicted MFS family arabinose efflux permease
MAVAVVVALFVLSETRRRVAPKFDYYGSAALMVGTGALMLVISQGAKWGWSDPVVVVSVVISPLCFGLFVAIERTSVAPLLPLEFFSRPNFTASIIGSLFTGAAYMGAYFIAPFLLIGVFGYSIAATSWVLLIRPVIFAASSPLGGAVSERWGERRTAVLGDGTLAVGLLILGVGAVQESVAVVMVGFVLQGLGHGLVRPPMSASLANSVVEHDLGIAAAAERMMFQVGAALGITVLTAVYGGNDEASAFVAAFGVGALLALAGMVAVSFLQSGHHQDAVENRERDRRDSAAH